MKKILIIGAGASGMTAAIKASENGAAVTVYEKNDKVGKKILSTGNGKCNLSNMDMDLSNYYTDNIPKLERCFALFSVNDTISFFQKYGLFIRDKDNYLYPYCEQASVVLDILRNALKEWNVLVETSVTDISVSVKKNGKFEVKSSVGKREFDAVILACGSKAGIKNTSVEGYEFAKQFGHRIVPVLPALVQVRCSNGFFKSVAGVRCKAKIVLFSDNGFLASEQGELQLTDYGISGIPVFQISRLIAQKLYKKQDVFVAIDFVPDFTNNEWETIVEERIRRCNDISCEEFLTGILHKKISMMLIKEFGLKPTDVVGNNKKTVRKLCHAMKEFTVNPESVNTYEMAQICCGGVDFNELTDELESVYQPGLYMCGEMIDIDGKCGGYNLQWAWTSGHIVGEAAAK